MSDLLDALPDVPTTTPDGQRPAPRIAGVQLREARTQIDERGELIELYDARWGLDQESHDFVYATMVRPNCVKGWVVHEHQDDRVGMLLGTFHWVLYDARIGSPTHGQIDEIYLGERRRGTMIIPRGVFHAVRNVGRTDAWFVNVPTAPYRHDRPDKRRLPLSTDQIPYRFPPGTFGW